MKNEQKHIRERYRRTHRQTEIEIKFMKRADMSSAKKDNFKTHVHQFLMGLNIGRQILTKSLSQNPATSQA